MKRTIIIGICLILLLFNLFPLGVDVDELNTAKDKQIKFINYTGENPRFTADEIREWGAKMAKDLEAGKAIGKYYNFFSVMHVVDPAEEQNFDSDIISISKYGGVNHIDTLRLILEGFFSYQYGFSISDSKTLAIFVTVYNAVHRGDVSYLGTKYKQKVMGYIDSTNAGLSTNYKDWPGKTKILVPLSKDAKKGDIGALNTDELTGDAVVEALREEEDRSLEEREAMNDLEDRILDEDEETLEEDRETLEEDREALEEDREALEEDRETLEEDRETLEEDIERLDEITDEEERLAEEERIAEEEERITDEEERITEEEERIADEEERITDEEERITDEEERITEEREDIEEDREDIERDRIIEDIEDDPETFADELIEERRDEDEKVYQGKFYYLKVKEFLTGGHYNNEMYVLDAPTGDTVAEAENHNICGRKYDIWPGKGVVVITHEGSHTAGHYLTLLDLDTLEILKKGEDNIFHRSFVEIRENRFIYAIAMQESFYYLGKYNENMEQVAISVEPIYADTFFAFYKDRIYVSNTAKEVLALSTTDLSLVEKIEP